VAEAAAGLNAAQEVAGDMVGLSDLVLCCMAVVMNSYRCPWALAMTGLAGLEVIQSRVAYRCSGSCSPLVLGLGLAET
jgi:hypothetical protein